MSGAAVLQAYRFALDPTPGQEQALRSHCGGQRSAYNSGLARANLAQCAAGCSYGLVDEQLTPSVSWSAYALMGCTSCPPAWCAATVRS